MQVRTSTFPALFLNFRPDFFVWFLLSQTQNPFRPFSQIDVSSSALYPNILENWFCFHQKYFFLQPMDSSLLFVFLLHLVFHVQIRAIARVCDPLKHISGLNIVLIIPLFVLWTSVSLNERPCELFSP